MAIVEFKKVKTMLIFDINVLLCFDILTMYAAAELGRKTAFQSTSCPLQLIVLIISCLSLSIQEEALCLHGRKIVLIRLRPKD